MDETELRLQALELLAEEILADMPAEAVMLARERIASQLVDGMPDYERQIILQALQAIDDARGRFSFGSGSFWIRPPG